MFKPFSRRSSIPRYLNKMRPNLDKSITLENFRAYYWLKAELIEICRKNILSPTGGKKELHKRIDHYLNTGERLVPTKKCSMEAINNKSPITLKTRLENSYKNDAVNRAFFKSVIGDRFKFNVVFMEWVKENSERTYQEAVNEWLKIEKEKKSGKKQKIGSQFEYNQYTRDFLNANPNKSRTEAITCWKYKKSIPGSNNYEDSDLDSLK